MIQFVSKLLLILLQCNKSCFYFAGNCYDKVRAESAEMKHQIATSQPTGPVEKPVVVLYEGEEGDKKFYSDANVVEMPKPRPSWFSKNLLSLSSFNIKSDFNSLKESDEIKVQIIKNEASDK